LEVKEGRGLFSVELMGKSKNLTQVIKQGYLDETIKCNKLRILNCNTSDLDKFGIALCVLVAAIALTAANAQSCTTCNCQFNNIQVLDQFVEANMNRILANEPSELLTVTIQIREGE
jgi:hypothetical protein